MDRGLKVTPAVGSIFKAFNARTTAGGIVEEVMCGRHSPIYFKKCSASRDLQRERSGCGGMKAGRKDVDPGDG